MIKFPYLIFFLIGVFSNSFSQKIIERELDATSISAIEIDSDNVFNITITSVDTKKLNISTTIEGENFENVLLSIKENNGLISIVPEHTPFFEAKNDKLSAHKVVAIEMALMVPKSIDIIIKSSLSSVSTLGRFKSIKANLGTGNCLLEGFSGDAQIKTKQGFIKVFANKSVYGIANSKKGIVTNELKSKGKYRIEAESFEGDISLFLIE